MSTLTFTPAEAQQIATMEQALATASFHQHYLTRVVYQSLTLDGLALRVQEAFGNGALYDHRYSHASGDYLVFLPNPSIPSDLVRQALQTVGVDRVVSETINAESVLAAENHFQGQKFGVCPEARRSRSSKPPISPLSAGCLRSPATGTRSAPDSWTSSSPHRLPGWCPKMRTRFKRSCAAGLFAPFHPPRGSP